VDACIAELGSKKSTLGLSVLREINILSMSSFGDFESGACHSAGDWILGKGLSVFISSMDLALSSL